MRIAPVFPRKGETPWWVEVEGVRPLEVMEKAEKAVVAMIGNDRLFYCNCIRSEIDAEIQEFLKFGELAK